MTLALGVLWLLAATDPCAAPPPGPPDPRAATAYLEVGDSERAHGNDEAAAIAYREALRRDPANASARAGLAASCRPAGDVFSTAVERMQAGDAAAAAPLFEAVRTRDGDLSAALLEGICRYELGQDDAATPLLKQSLADPTLADSARLFLGLIALRNGRSAEARDLFDATANARDPAVAELAPGLRRLASHDGRLGISFLAEAGYDSNVDLAPDGTPVAGQSGDFSGALAGSIVGKPFGNSGVYLRLDGQLRQQMEILAYDLASAQGSVGWEYSRESKHLLVEYSYFAMELGGAPYLFAHHLSAAVQWPVGSVLLLGGRYDLRLENYEDHPGAAYQGYSGLRQVGDLQAGLRAGSVLLTARYQLGADTTETAWFGYGEQGPGASLLWSFGSARLSLDAGVLFRTYTAIDPAYMAQRKDVLAEGALTLDVEVAENWAVRGSVQARRNVSNIANLSYTQVVAQIGLVYAAGFF